LNDRALFRDQIENLNFEIERVIFRHSHFENSNFQVLEIQTDSDGDDVAMFG
jgi:hypothetical protein